MGSKSCGTDTGKWGEFLGIEFEIIRPALRKMGPVYVCSSGFFGKTNGSVALNSATPIT